MQESDGEYTPRAKRARLRSLRNRNEDIPDANNEVVDLTVEETEIEPGTSNSREIEHPPVRLPSRRNRIPLKTDVDKQFYEFITSKAYDINANIGIRLQRLLRNVLTQYGISDFTPPRSCLYRLFRDPFVVVNLTECLRSLDYFADLVNVHSWQESYLAPAKLASQSEEIRVFFAQKAFSVMIGLRKHIYANQWDAVRQIMADFDFNPIGRAGNNPWYWRVLVVLYSFRWPQLYSVLLQWILLTKDVCDEKMKAVDELLDCFKLTLLSNVTITRNVFPLYASTALVAAVAHEHIPSLQKLVKLKIKPKDNDPEYHAVMTNYMYLAQFRLLTLKNTPIENYQWNNLFDSISSSIINAIDHHTRLLCLIEPLLTVGEMLKREGEAVETVTDLCTEVPALLPFVCTIMARTGYTSNIGGIISEVMENTPPPFLHQFPLVLHYIGNRALLAEQTFHYEIVENNVRILLDFLDQGRNRSRGEAWTSLWVHLNAMSMIPQWLRDEWADRASWWPRFHSKVDVGDCARERRKCLHFFRKKCGKIV